jgi:tyrosyl-tRNA synthetase
LQLCGADQWTNCIAGVGLIKKKTGGEANVLSNPLIINKSTGKKFGKSESGAVWLDPNKTSPFEMYQFWLNTDDESVQDYVKIFTEITKEEYDNLIEQFNGDRSARFAQKYLAFEVTKLVHGTEEAWKAKEQSEAIFEQGSAESAPEVVVEKSLLEGEQINLLEILTASEILESKSKAREMINSGAVSVNDVKVDVFGIANPLKNNQELTVRVGKKKYYKIIAK